jgi:hypothetical protein
MARNIDDRTLLDSAEVKEKYGWNYNTLYYFHKAGLLSEPEKFHGERHKTYWYEDELDRVKNRPRSETARGFKGNPSVPRIFSDPGAAESMLQRLTGTGAAPAKSE